MLGLDASDLLLGCSLLKAFSFCRQQSTRPATSSTQNLGNKINTPAILRKQKKIFNKDFDREDNSR
jgi:hypothetical protein